MSEALLAALKEAASPRAWSAGVSLARAGRVQRDGQRGSELGFRVSSPGQAAPHTVVLDADELVWSCDCPAREDACAHVVAAGIALKEAEKGAVALTTSTRPRLAVGYDLVRSGAEWRIDRALVTVAPEPARAPLTGTLQAVVEERRRDADLELTDGDRAVDRLLERARRRPLDSGQVAEVLRALDGHRHVTLDGAPVTLDKAPLLPVGRVRRAGGRALFEIVAPQSFVEVVLPGLALAGGALRPLGEVGLCGARWEKLPLVESFERERWAELVLERVPLMSARFPVEVASPELPTSGARERPRIELGLTVAHGRVALFPELVYGRPPVLVIEGGRARYLGGARIPARDRGAELALLERLRDKLNLVTARRVEVGGADAQQLMERLRAWNGEVDEEEAFDLSLRAAPVRPRLELDGERPRVSFESAGPDGAIARADTAAVLEAWQAGFSQVPLLDGGFAPLPVDWLDRHGPRLVALLAARDEGAPLAAMLPDLAALSDALEQPPPAELSRLAPLLGDFTGIPSAPRPADLTASLRPYQARGVDWLAFLRSAGLGAVLADDMGLGKTLQTLCVLEGKSLVVCPTSVVHNWARELSRFRPGLRACIYHGPKRALDATADVVVTTYALLRLDQAQLSAATWDVVVLDEAQAIKNPDSQAARAAFELPARFRVSLSGTPLENRLEELWSQLHFTNRGVLGGRRDFERHYARPIAEGDRARAAELRARIRPFVLRRLKEAVAPELPPRTETQLFVELSAAEREVYESVRLATREEVLAQLAAGGSVLGALEVLLRLRQAACHSALVPGQVATSSSKLEALVERLAEVVAEGHRALVFSQWTALLDHAEGALDAAGIERLRLDGSTTDRGALVERFQSGEGPAVFLISLKAGGTGLNLTAADHVFFLDPWWNPAVEAQAADRAHRIGQTRPVFVHRLVAKDTVEEKILLLQDKKRQLAELALSGAGEAAAVTREDLLALLE